MVLSTLFVLSVSELRDEAGWNFFCVSQILSLVLDFEAWWEEQGLGPSSALTAGDLKQVM